MSDFFPVLGKIKQPSHTHSSPCHRLEGVKSTQPGKEGQGVIIAWLYTVIPLSSDATMQADGHKES